MPSANPSPASAIRSRPQDSILTTIVETKVPKFNDGGEDLKSGQKTKLFLNFGRAFASRALQAIACGIADRMVAEKVVMPGQQHPVHLVGSAYKGIVLGAAVLNYLYTEYNVPGELTLTRKEQKKNADKGRLFGHKIPDGATVYLIDDVFTAGTATKDTLMALAESYCSKKRGKLKIKIGGVFVIVNRNRTPAPELTKQLGFPVYALLTLQELLAYLGKVEYLTGSQVRAVKDEQQIP